MAPEKPATYGPVKVGALGSTGGKRRTAWAASNVPIGLAIIAIPGIGANGFSSRFGGDGRCSAVAIVPAVGLLAASGIGFGASDTASMSGGVAGCGLGGGSLMGCTAVLAAGVCEGSTAAGAGLGAAGGAASIFAVDGAVGPLIRHTIG